MGLFINSQPSTRRGEVSFKKRESYIFVDQDT